MSTLDEIAVLLTGIFERPLALRADMTAGDIVGWDSFKHVEILMEIEEHYGIEVPTTEAARMKTLGDLAALVDRKRAGSVAR